MADPAAIHACKRLGGGAAGWEAARGGLSSAPGHENVWEEHLRAAGDLANLAMHLHG
jgi:hypothetical protein